MKISRGLGIAGMVIGIVGIVVSVVAVILSLVCCARTSPKRRIR